MSQRKADHSLRCQKRLNTAYVATTYGDQGAHPPRCQKGFPEPRAFGKLLSWKLVL